LAIGSHEVYFVLNPVHFTLHVIFPPACANKLVEREGEEGEQRREDEGRDESMAKSKWERCTVF
jgi:hypothetical protein